MAEIDWSRLHPVLEEYDQVNARWQDLDALSTDKAVARLTKAEEDAAEKVRRVFLELTAHLNTWSQVKVIPVEHIRLLVQAPNGAGGKA